MQTAFTRNNLCDPDIAASNQVLRACVHCGFCTATCPTFLLLGDELDSPRGRIYMNKDMLESGCPATELVVRHIDRCLSCLSCMTTCPSGVHYMHLVDHARTHIEETYRRPWHERLLRAAHWPPRCRVSEAVPQPACASAARCVRCCAAASRQRPVHAPSPSDARAGAGAPAPSATETLRVHLGPGDPSRPCRAAGRLRPAGAFGARRSTRPPSACSPGSVSRWWRHRAPAAAARWSSTWAATPRR